MLALVYPLPLFGEVLCKKDSVSRTISVVDSRPVLPLPCEVVYERSEARGIETLWSPKNQPGYCEKKAKQLIKEFESKS